ncbi:MAG: transketolase C-terminal domain-containing protein, partial [Acidimicrobiia bacterium]|nr:transketolase C-terminal domain-containing protein [Acidimicrobiia bacterium]
AVNRTDGPTAIVLTRQGLRIPERAPEVTDVARGGYVRVPGEDVVLVATGSEVPLAVAAAALATREGVSIRVVSMPSIEVFDRQDASYRASVLGSDLPVFTIEAGVTRGWLAVAARGGEPIGIDRFGASAPAGVLAEEFGFTPEAVFARIQESLNEAKEHG